MFARYAQWILDYPRKAIGIIIAFCLLSLLCASTLKINTNILDLLPPDEPSTIAVRKLQAEEGQIGSLTIGLKGKPDEVRIVLEELSTKFQADEMVEYAVYDIPADWKKRLGILQLTVPELKELESKLMSGLSLGPAAMNPFLASQLFALGPLSDKLAKNALPFEDDGIYRLLVRPTGSPFDPSFAIPFWKKANSILDSVDMESHDVDLVWLGGAYRHAVEDREVILKDVSKTGGISLVLVMLLVFAAFRDVRAIVILFTPLFIGAIGTWGLTAILIGEVNTFTSTFTAILFGLGVDFSIHLYSRYREEFAELQNMNDAVVKAFACAGPPCLTAAITSVGGFLSLRFAGFVGFQQLGVVLAVGVLCCLLAVLTALPLMILWLDPKDRDVTLLRPPFRANLSVGYHRAGWWLALVIVLGALSWKVIPELSFEYDLSALRPNGMAYNELSAAERAVARKSFRPIVVTVDSDEELLALHNRLTDVVNKKESAYIQQIFSVYSVLPPDQSARLEILRRIQAMNNDENIMYLPPPVQQNIASLQDIPLDILQAADLPKEVQSVFGSGSGKHRVVIIPDGNMWDIRENNNLAESLQQILPEKASAAGEYLALASLYRLISKDTVLISSIALSLVLLFSWIDIKSLKRSLSAVGILLIGMSWAGAGLYFADIHFSLVNFVGIPIVIGIGIDVIIHLLHRISEEGPGRIRFALQTTGFASFISAATTILSFSSLLFASNRGLHSMGKMIVVGLTLVTLVAFIAVPLGWMSTWFTRNQAPDKQDDAS